MTEPIISSDVDRISPDDMRSRILAHFLSAPDQTVTGTSISRAMGITRAAVWKHIRSLEALGFVFEAAPRVGYRLVHTPDICLMPFVQRHLPETAQFGRWIEWWTQVDSTNRIALQRIDDIPHGGVVTALRQNGGRGRRGKAWASPDGGLWMSLVLKEPILLARAAELTLMAAVAIRRAVIRITGLEADIKWPNDLLIGNRKVCGILAEIRADGEWVQHAIVGIGLNLNVDIDALPTEVQSIATSLSGEVERPLSAAGMMSAILTEFEPLAASLWQGGPGFSAVAKEWREHCVTLGRLVKIQTPHGLEEGLASHADDNGVLYLKTANGEVRAIHSGDVLF